nr:hypothetical protein [Pandoravirus aubagnensis]
MVTGDGGLSSTTVVEPAPRDRIIFFSSLFPCFFPVALLDASARSLCTCLFGVSFFEFSYLFFSWFSLLFCVDGALKARTTAAAVGVQTRLPFCPWGHRFQGSASVCGICPAARRSSTRHSRQSHAKNTCTAITCRAHAPHPLAPLHACPLHAQKHAKE